MNMPIDQNQAVIAWLISILIELVKHSKHPLFAWIDHSKDAICRGTSALAAIASGVGFTFSGSLLAGGMLTVPPLRVLVSNMLAALMAQEVLYRVAVKPSVNLVPKAKP